MESISTTRKILLRTFYGFLLFGLVVTLVGIWGLKPLLSRRIKDAVLKSTNGLYQIDFKDIQYSPVTGNAEIKNVTWKPDFMLFDKLRAERKLPNNVFECRVEEINLTGLKPWTIISSKRLNINSISVANPFIEILHEKHEYNTTNKSKTPYQIISKFVNSFRLIKLSSQILVWPTQTYQSRNEQKVVKLKALI